MGRGEAGKALAGRGVGVVFMRFGRGIYFGYKIEGDEVQEEDWNIWRQRKSYGQSI